VFESNQPPPQFQTPPQFQQPPPQFPPPPQQFQQPLNPYAHVNHQRNPPPPQQFPPPPPPQVAPPTRSKWIALLICFFFGATGAHRFYEGKPGFGILHASAFILLWVAAVLDLDVLGPLLIVGLFVTWIVDLIRILVKPTKFY
jgi:TM2 domain-containing membrane protein YozV